MKCVEYFFGLIFVLLAGAVMFFGNPCCWVSECCKPNWTSYNKTKLEMALKQRVIGQHVASPIILKMVTGHMEDLNPKKPLVLSLHGLAGTGKNFMSQLIVESIYHNGMDSRFVHLLIATRDFPHMAHLQTYKNHLEKWVKGNITECPRSVFIFDEMDKMIPGLIDAIKPYLDYHINLDGVSYREAIFIFLSNAGGVDIAEVTQDFWKKGRSREEIRLMDLEEAVSFSVFNNKNSGLWQSSLISRHLVDSYVPFLPLEKRHVIRCALAEMAAKGMWPELDVAEKLAKEYIYFPRTEPVFSTQGCKLISQRLNLYLS